MYCTFNIVIFIVIIILVVSANINVSNKDGFLDSYHRCISQGYSSNFCLKEPV